MTTIGDAKCASVSSVNEAMVADYQRLTEDSGLVDLQSLSQIEVTGQDRSRFLHNLCTNDILRLTPGQACEAFITNVQGKTVGHGIFYCDDSRFVFVTVPGQAEKLIPHWDRYLITEDVQLTDRSSDWHAWLVAGPRVLEVLKRLGLSAALLDDHPSESVPLASSRIQREDVDAQVRRVPWLRVPAWLVVVEEPQANRLRSWLIEAGAAECGAEAFHMARIEAAFPWYGWDVSDKNLPQEVDRNELAISFRKGCYLGQETVARLDALGHVNRVLTKWVATDQRVPGVGESIMVDGQPVGEITSSAFLPSSGRGAALGYVRCAALDSGAKLMTSGQIELEK